MPDSAGALTPDDNAKIRSWWEQHWKDPVVCPVCKTREWTIAPHVVNLQRHALDSLVANTVSYPHIVVTCKTCAHSMFFNSVQMGISLRHEAPTNALASLLAAAPNLGAPVPTNSLASLLTKKSE
jgi:hypothetical protein